MTNKLHTALYVGLTSDLLARVWKHKNNAYAGSHTSRYNCYKLVYYEFYPHIEEAIAVEKAIKGGSRKAKIKLVNNMNSEWKDLYDGLMEN